MLTLEERLIRLERVPRELAALRARVSALEHTNLLLAQALEKVSRGTRFTFHKEGGAGHLNEEEVHEMAKVKDPTDYDKAVYKPKPDLPNSARSKSEKRRRAASKSKQRKGGKS